MSISLSPCVMLNLFQHNALPHFILKQVEDDAVYCREWAL
jgi:hypothetical protein